MKWSILILSWDRLDNLKEVWANNIDPIVEEYKHDCEILICDQGTTRIDELKKFLASKKQVAFTRFNNRNEGNPRALNQLFIRSKGENIAVMGNDIVLPKDWYKRAEEAFLKVPKCGLVGIECSKEAPPVQEINGYKYRPARGDEPVFGDWFFKRDLIDDVGAFCPDYHPYALWDSDYNARVRIAGYQSFYLDGVKSRHSCNDVGEKNDYRKMKDFSIANNAHNHHVRQRSYARFGYWIPFPPKIMSW